MVFDAKYICKTCEWGQMSIDDQGDGALKATCGICGGELIPIFEHKRRKKCKK